MSYLLRKVSFSKWEPNRRKDPLNYTADAITGCTRTQKNTLSVWYSESPDYNSDEVEKIIVALATTMTQPDTIDLVFLQDDWLKEKGIELVNMKANTIYTSVNCRHRDLSSLDYEKLAIIGEHIVKQINDNEEFKRKILKSDLVKLVAKWIIKDNEFSVENMSPKWHRLLELEIEKIKKNAN